MLGRNLVLDLQPHSLGLNVTLKGTLIGATGQDSPWLVCAGAVDTSPFIRSKLLSNRC